MGYSVRLDTIQSFPKRNPRSNSPSSAQHFVKMGLYVSLVFYLALLMSNGSTVSRYLEDRADAAQRSDEAVELKKDIDDLELTLVKIEKLKHLKGCLKRRNLSRKLTSRPSQTFRLKRTR